MSDRALELAGAVREWRKRLRLRQEELAELAGSSVRFVHTVEAGKQTLRLDKLLDVLAVLGLGLDIVRGDGSLRVSGELDP